MARRRAKKRQNPADLRHLRRAIERLDALSNPVTGLGIPGVDQSTATVRGRMRYSPDRARDEYEGSWAAQAELDRPAEDITREGFEFEGLPPWVSVDAVWAYCDDLGSAVASEAPEDRGLLAAMSALFLESYKLGGAALLFVLADGLPPWEPVNLERIESIKSVELLERDELTPVRAMTGEITHYVIGSPRTSVTVAGLVHISRFVVSKGVRLGPRREYYEMGWGMSALSVLHYERTNMHAANQEAGAALGKINVDVIAIAGMDEAFCEPEQRQYLDQWIETAAAARSNHRILPIDGGRDAAGQKAGRRSDQYMPHTRSVDGIEKVWDMQSNAWAAGTRQTPGIALGKVVGGLSNGEQGSDWKSWSGRVSGIQRTWLAPRLDRGFTFVFAAKDGPTGGRIPASWKYNFRPLSKPSELELEQIRSTRTATDLAMVAAGMISVEEVADQRLRKGSTGELSLPEIEPMPEGGQPPTEAVEAEQDSDVTVNRDLLEVHTQLTQQLQQGMSLKEALWGLHMATGGKADIEGARLAWAQYDRPETDEAEGAAATPEIERPSDLATSTAISKQLEETLGHRITPHKITRLGADGKISRWTLSGKWVYSRGEVAAFFDREMGLIGDDEAEAVEEAEQ